MALSRTTVFSANSASSFGTGTYTTGSFTPPDNSLLVVAVCAMEEGGSTDPTGDLTVSGGGWTYTPRVNIGRADTWSHGVRVWTAPITTGASMTLAFDCGARDIFRYVTSVIAYTGYDTGIPTGATATDAAIATTGADSITLSASPLTGAEVLGALGSDTAAGSTPGTGWTEIHDLQGLGDCGLETQVRAATAIGPTFSSAGAGAITEASGGALSPASPATVNAGDLLSIFAYYEGTATTPSTPSGFTLIDGPRTLASSVGRCWVFGKIADGTEDGAANALGTPAVTTMRAARCYRFINVRSDTVANVVGGFDFAGPASAAAIPDVGVTTPEDNCLAVNLITVADDNALVSYTGMTGGTWAEAVAEYTSAATTPDYAQQLQTAPMAAAGTVNGGSQTMAAADPWGVVGFYIRGGTTFDPVVSWVNVDTGGGAGIVGVAIEIRAAVGDATASPAVIARTISVPASAVSVGAAPSVIARSTTHPQAAVSVGAAPAVIARSTVHPQVAVSVGVAPAVIALAATIPPATAAESTTVTPATISLAVTMPAASVSVGVAPAVITLAATLPQVAVGVGVAPAVIALAFAIPQATVTIVEPTPPRPPVLVFDEAVRRSRFLRLEWPQALIDLGPPIEVTAGDATVTPAAIALSITTPQVAVSVGVAPAVLAFAPIVNSATVSVGVAPAIIALAIVMPASTESVGVAPATIVLAVTIPPATAGGSGVAAPATIALAITMPASTESVGVAPATVALACVIPQVTATGDAGAVSVAPDAIVLALTVLQVAVSAEFAKPWKLLGGGAPMRSRQKYPNRRAGWT